ncbi:hypothetical protein L2E82_20741 [Cichorium intybus]|uniref:Uncharacterized protein n=1 Tax=Cichorium intybus TaxID=13427 RepID=A0ACB9DV69_CICIN|nr:hypothetical protein L2E82_20741 [Cichorium intybus]
MEKNSQSPSSPPPPSTSSSFTNQLFGDNDSQQSSTGIFASIFPSPSTVARNPSFLQLTHPIQCQTINGTSANANSGVVNMDKRSIFQERIEPYPLSSSIYYGGQEDMYIRSSNDLTSKSCTKVEEDQDGVGLPSPEIQDGGNGSLSSI